MQFNTEEYILNADFCKSNTDTRRFHNQDNLRPSVFYNLRESALSNIFLVFDLGLVDFKEAWQFQKKVFEDVKSGLFKSALILCQHYPVVTLGRQALKENIRVCEYELKNMGIGVYKIERGGDVTYHGPGQVVAYPVFNLNWFKKDIHLYLRQLEEVIIDFLSDFGIQGSRYEGLTGVWIDGKKIASIGIAIRNWVSFHGLSINIKKDDLENFGLIRPCGMEIEMTALEKVLERELDIDNIKGNLTSKFESAFSTQYTIRNTCLPAGRAQYTIR